jgi:hypothetical protein
MRRRKKARLDRMNEEDQGEEEAPNDKNMLFEDDDDADDDNVEVFKKKETQAHKVPVHKAA